MNTVRCEHCEMCTPWCIILPDAVHLSLSPSLPPFLPPSFPPSRLASVSVISCIIFICLCVSLYNSFYVYSYDTRFSVNVLQISSQASYPMLAFTVLFLIAKYYSFKTKRQQKSSYCWIFTLSI